MTEMEATRERLIKAFDALPDDAPDQHFARLVYLISWTEDHPNATRAEYLEEMEQVRKGGPKWRTEARKTTAT